MKYKTTFDSLLTPETYMDEIEYRFAKKAGVFRNNSNEELTTADYFFHRRKIAKKIARTISRGEYKLTPLVERSAHIDNKERLLYQSHSLDAIVIGAFARLLTKMVEPLLSNTVYSYRKGMSAICAIEALKKYITNHKSSRPDKKSRGLYVLKRDISAYGESIPTHENSALWPSLETVLSTGTDSSSMSVLWPLLQQMIRPAIVDKSGVATVLETGVPTGSSIQPVICNLYLSSLDEHLGAIEGGFYARYGDDFLFAHPDPGIAKQASDFIDNKVSALELQIKSTKKMNYYITGAGHASDLWPETTPLPHIEHLGYRLRFSGAIGMKRKKVRDLQQDLRARIANTLLQLRNEPVPVQLDTVCNVVNVALDPMSPLCHRSAQMLFHLVNDRAQLKHLDYLIALEIASAISSKQGVRSFREVPYRNLREMHRLRSLEFSRNKQKRRDHP